MAGELAGGPGRVIEPMSCTVLAHEVVAEVAPRELELMSEVDARWAAGELGGRAGGSGGSLGLGLDPDVLALFVYPVAVGALTAVAGDLVDQGGRAMWRRFVRGLRRLLRRPGPPPVSTPPLRADQLAEVRRACRARGVAAGLAPVKAGLLADAVVGVLIRRLPPGDERR